jgi:hypothetical protein
VNRLVLRLAVVVFGALAGLPVGSASAEPAPGALAVLPAHGTDQSALTVVTATACRLGTNLLVTISGPGFPAAGQNIVGNTALTAFEHTRTGGLVIPVSLVLRDVANLPSKQVTYGGTYVVTVTCRDRVRLPALSTFAGALTFHDPHTYAAANAAVATQVAPLDVTSGPPLGTGPAQGSAAPPSAAASTASGEQGTAPSASAPVARDTVRQQHGSWVDWAGPIVMGAGALGLLLSVLTAVRRRSALVEPSAASATPAPVSTHSSS